MDSLQHCLVPREIRTFLKGLTRGSEAHGSVYDNAYEDAMTRVYSQPQSHKTLARKIFTWLTYEMQPLDGYTLRGALSIEPGDTELDEEDMPTHDQMLSVCAGLVVHDIATKVFRLVHVTTNDYLEQHGKRWMPCGHLEIASVCMTWLGQIYGRKAKYPENMVLGAMKRLAYHLEAATREPRSFEEPALSQLVLPLIQNIGKVTLPLWLCCAARNNPPVYPGEGTLIHAAACLGLSSLVLYIVKHLSCLNQRTSSSCTTIMLATAEQREALALSLLNTKGIDLLAKNLFGETVLHVAAFTGNITLIKAILRSELSLVNSTNRDGQTPLFRLFLAARRRVVTSENLARLLKVFIDAGADVDHTDATGRTALICATQVNACYNPPARLTWKW